MRTSRDSADIPEYDSKERSQPGIAKHDFVGKTETCQSRRRDNVEELRRRVYGFSDLSGYTFIDRLIIRAADIFFYLLISLICATLRWEVIGGEHLTQIEQNGAPAIYTFWHACIFIGTWFWRKRGIVVMSSRSRDGEYVGRFIKRFGYGAARGSASRGSGRALAEMDECLAAGIDVAFPIDGPRGPAHVAKLGAVTLARHSGRAIFLFHLTARRYLELPSWDRQQIPYPFTSAVTLIAEPIYVPHDSSADEIEAFQSEVQRTLDDLRREGERWRRKSREV